MYRKKNNSHPERRAHLINKEKHFLLTRKSTSYKEGKALLIKKEKHFSLLIEKKEQFFKTNK